MEYFWLNHVAKTLLIILLSLSYVRSAGEGSSTAHVHTERDYFIEDLFTPIQKDYYRRSLFPTFKRCATVDPVRANRPVLENRTSTWSSTLSVFVFPNDDIITPGGRALLEKAYNEDPNYIKAQFGVLIFFLLAIVVALLSAFYIPIAGSILFWLCEGIYHLLTNKWFRKVGRKLLIWKELRRRKNELRLLKYAEVRRTPPKPKFRMPKFFRDQDEEDIPEELKAPHGNVFGGSDSDDFDVEEAYLELQEVEKNTLEALIAKLQAEKRAAEEAKEEADRELRKELQLLRKRKGKKNRKSGGSTNKGASLGTTGLSLKPDKSKKSNKKPSKKKPKK